MRWRRDWIRKPVQALNQTAGSEKNADGANDGTSQQNFKLQKHNATNKKNKKTQPNPGRSTVNCITPHHKSFSWLPSTMQTEGNKGIKSGVVKQANQITMKPLVLWPGAGHILLSGHTGSHFDLGPGATLSSPYTHQRADGKGIIGGGNQGWAVEASTSQVIQYQIWIRSVYVRFTATVILISPLQGSRRQSTLGCLTVSTATSGKRCFPAVVEPKWSARPSTIHRQQQQHQQWWRRQRQTTASVYKPTPPKTATTDKNVKVWSRPWTLI